MDTSQFNHIVGELQQGEPATIRFYGKITGESASRFNSEFDYVESIRPSLIRVLINCEGGSVLHGMSAYSTIQNSKIPTECVNEGMAASMGSILWAAGTRSLMRDYAILMIHNPFLPSAEDSKTNDMVLAFTRQIKTIYRKRFGLSESHVEAIMNGETGKDGTFFDADAAVRAGIIPGDHILTTTPTSNHGAKGAGGENEYQLTERHLIPQDFMVYLEFNPRDYEKYWKFAQPDGNLVFRDLDPKIQATMLRLLMDKKNEYIGNAIWTAAKGGSAASGVTHPAGCIEIGRGKEKYFDGVVKRILDNVTATDAETIAGGQCVISGTTQLVDGAAVEAALYAMWKKCPKQIRKKSGLSFIIGWDAWDAYDQYISDKQVKYSENTEVNRYRFKGKRILPIVGIPEHTIVLGEFTTGMDSNLWMGVDYANDTDVLKVDRLQANSELFFFQMRMKMDVNIVRPAEIVVHTAYTKP